MGEASGLLCILRRHSSGGRNWRANSAKSSHHLVFLPQSSVYWDATVQPACSRVARCHGTSRFIRETQPAENPAVVRVEEITLSISNVCSEWVKLGDGVVYRVLPSANRAERGDFPPARKIGTLFLGVLGLGIDFCNQCFRR